MPFANPILAIPSLDEDALKLLIRQAVDRLASLDSIGGVQDFLSDCSFELEEEVEARDSARGWAEAQARNEEGRV